MVVVINSEDYHTQISDTKRNTPKNKMHFSRVVLMYVFKASYQQVLKTQSSDRLSVTSDPLTITRPVQKIHYYFKYSENTQHDKVTVPHNAVKDLDPVREKKKSLNQLL
jgi:hypothetical protein